MESSKIFGSWLHGHSYPAGESQDWRDSVRRELVDERSRGVGRREMVERLAQQMYAEDLRDLGQVADLGFFTWQLYVGAAQFVVNYLLPDTEITEGQTGSQPGNEGRRIA